MTYLHSRQTRDAFTQVELLVVIAIIVVLSAIGFTVFTSMRQSSQLTQSTQKFRDLGAAFVAYTNDSNGLLPYVDASQGDGWVDAADPENKEVWYNALPRSMGAPGVGDFSKNPEAFYHESYPLYIPDAPYPKNDKKLSKPYFAVAMNNRLQRSDDEVGGSKRETLASIREPARTVAFLERGMPGDNKVYTGQKGFDGGPKASPRAFVERRDQKGVLVFVDGHCEARSVFDLLEQSGMIKFPQTEIVWTKEPDEDPN